MGGSYGQTDKRFSGRMCSKSPDDGEAVSPAGPRFCFIHSDRGVRSSGRYPRKRRIARVRFTQRNPETTRRISLYLLLVLRLDFHRSSHRSAQFAKGTPCPHKLAPRKKPKRTCSRSGALPVIHSRPGATMGTTIPKKCSRLKAQPKPVCPFLKGWCCQRCTLAFVFQPTNPTASAGTASGLPGLVRAGPDFLDELPVAVATGYRMPRFGGTISSL